MKRLLLMLLITCATAGIANAQLGKLKDLAKKAGNAAKEQVQKSRQAAEKVQDTKQTVEVKESLEAISEKVEKEVQGQVQKVANGLAEDEYIVEHYNYYDDKSIGLKGDNLGMYAKARKTDWEDLQKYAFDPENWHPYTKYVEI